MIKFSKEKVLLLHQLIAQETGGSIGVRDEGLLESALENAFSGFGGEEFYPTKEEKGARLGYSLISNQAFALDTTPVDPYIHGFAQPGQESRSPIARSEEVNSQRFSFA